jgi:DNA-directed RNA polymerase subunit RPC12/RpoP
MTHVKANRCPSCGSPHVTGNKCISCGTELKIESLLGGLRVNATTEQISFLFESAARNYERAQFGTAIRCLQQARAASTDASEVESINAFIEMVGSQLMVMSRGAA